MKIVDSKETFENAVCTAVEASGDIFEYMESYLESAEEWLRYQVVGTPFFESAQTLAPVLFRELEIIVSMKAFREAVPYLDLVLTPNGFAVVSNSNLVPASPERVKNLSNQLVNGMEDAIDRLIIALYQTQEEWKVFASGEPFEELTDSLFWTAREITQYMGVSAAHRSSLDKFRPQIFEQQEYLKEAISEDYFNELLKKMRTKELTAEEKVFVTKCRKYVGLKIKGLEWSAERNLYSVINALECDPDKYPTYHNSIEYKAKTMPKYENRKKDATFFFG